MPGEGKRKSAAQSAHVPGTNFLLCSRHRARAQSRFLYFVILHEIKRSRASSTQLNEANNRISVKGRGGNISVYIYSITRIKINGNIIIINATTICVTLLLSQTCGLDFLMQQHCSSVFLFFFFFKMDTRAADWSTPSFIKCTYVKIVRQVTQHVLPGVGINPFFEQLSSSKGC